MIRRALAAVAAVALTLVAVSAASPATADDHLGAPYVALGDSMASGNGNLPYVDPGCLRSARSYPMQISAATGWEVASAACSGATTLDVFDPSDPWAGQIGQLALAGELGGGTKVVTLTVGINDLGWQEVLKLCATPGMEVDCADAIQAMYLAGGMVPDRLAAILQAIRTAAPQAAIVVTGYPKLFGNVAKSCSIGNVDRTPVKLPASLTSMANVVIDGAADAPGPDPAPGLNDAIAGAVWGFAAVDGNTLFVDVDAAFQTHRLCDTSDRWISGLIRGVPVDRGLHPNMAGMTAFAGSILSNLP
jgi:lysophospholipase L1-like esterase